MSVPLVLSDEPTGSLNAESAKAVLAALLDAADTAVLVVTHDPEVAARSVWTRVEALLRVRDFLEAYREARARWISGFAAAFPPGTYWLRRFANVPIST